MINFPYFNIHFSIILLGTGIFYLISDRGSSGKFFGGIFILSGSFLFGYLFLLNNYYGAPIEMARIKPLYEVQLEKRIDQSLSLVKTIDNIRKDDKRVVKDIPIEVREGDVFMIKRDGSVVIIKSPPNQH
ncbi:hypothetical protein A2907_01210 [Candidatus Azambacteria bacterium RIFCSPLOWO2_01_FULL_37_9]|uniref:Uncharacterized protein n=1 Tax=Candidatus Azambacteria bacterium RIFCSPLOWO2_01_FULL_37_9 TaxID=1797297 RepID=A0A1F5C8A6_9BACT|nr:MAG: hypothetical protein A2907_01210 [Candidatus Azambacteria bacterium RIFCSPLOWO2_01_FULL_37_9]